MSDRRPHSETVIDMILSVINDRELDLVVKYINDTVFRENHDVIAGALLAKARSLGLGVVVEGAIVGLMEHKREAEEEAQRRRAEELHQIAADARSDCN
jgi:hypothetical protein